MSPDTPKGRNPVDAPKCGDYGHRNKAGKSCGQFVVGGTENCRHHAGKSLARQKAAGAVVREVQSWGLGDSTVDPGEVLLRLVSQSARRSDMYAGELGKAYEAAERLRVAHEAGELIEAYGGDADEMSAAKQVACEDLGRIFNSGGIAALVGHTYSATNSGGIFATGEAIRGLAKLEADERDRCAGFAAKAVAAGLAERQVRIAERMAEQMIRVFQRITDQLELTPEQRALVPGIVEREVGSLMVINGGRA